MGKIRRHEAVQSLPDSPDRTTRLDRFIIFRAQDPGVVRPPGGPIILAEIAPLTDHAYTHDGQPAVPFIRKAHADVRAPIGTVAVNPVTAHGHLHLDQAIVIAGLEPEPRLLPG